MARRKVSYNPITGMKVVFGAGGRIVRNVGGRKPKRRFKFGRMFRFR